MLSNILESQSMVPVCYHPMTVVLVDDDEVYLKNLKRFLAKSFPCKTFSVPQEALQYLNNEYNELPFTYRCFEQLAESDRNSRLTGIDFRMIQQEAYRPQRFEQITIVIIDYAMPEMNGLEFVRGLKNKRLKSILLTGEASADIALEAFNRREIYQYIRKDQDPRIIESTLIEWITDIQQKYFSSYSLPAVNSLLVNEERPISTLIDPAYISLVNETITSRKAVEYYVTEALGSIVMFDRDGVPSWLSICDEQEINELIYRAELEGATPEVLDALKTRKKIPFFLNDEQLASPPSSWGQYLHTAKLLKGQQDYWYAHITDPAAYKLPNEIVSLDTYLNEQG